MKLLEAIVGLGSSIFSSVVGVLIRLVYVCTIFTKTEMYDNVFIKVHKSGTDCVFLLLCIYRLFSHESIKFYASCPRSLAKAFNTVST